MVDNFIKIEMFVNEKNLTSEEKNQLNYEFNYYSYNYSYNYLLFKNIEKIFFSKLILKNFFSKESDFLNEFIDFNKNFLKINNIPFDYYIYTSQLITNWILLSFDTTLFDRTLIENKIFYFNRYDCIDKFVLFFNNYLVFYNNNYKPNKINNKTIQNLAFTLFMLLVEHNIFNKTIKKIKLKKNLQKKIVNYVKSYMFFYFKANEFKNNIINFNILLIKPKIKILNKTYYFIGIHYISLIKIFKSNSRSKKEFNLNDTTLLDKLSSLQYTIDFEMYFFIKKLLMDKLNISSDDNFRTKILNLINNYKNLSYYSENDGKFYDSIENQSTESKYTMYYIFSEIEYYLKNINNFYLVTTFDFRGRFYSKSCISPMGSFIFRYLYYYGYYNPNEIELLNKKDLNLDNKIKNLIINNEPLKNTLNRIKFTNSIIIYLYWSLFELGKINKNKLVLDLQGKLKDYDFIKEGLNIFGSNTNDLLLEKQIQIEYIKKGIYNLNKNIFKKIIVWKDSTASGIQLLSVVLGNVNSEIVKQCNLNSIDYWYDTYFYIINLFKIKYKNNLVKNDNKYLLRQNLKRIIMTYLYGAGKDTIKNYYIESINKEIDLDLDRAEFIIDIFYNFLNELFKKNQFFKIPLNDLKLIFETQNKKNKEKILITSDYSKIYLDYYLIINYKLDRIINNKRNTIIYTSLSSLYDNNKTSISLIANIAQTFDALFARLILNDLKYPIITIHDSFGIDILSVNNLINLANFNINKIYYISTFNEEKPNKNYYSKYILL